ncbi:hypothetical protein JYU34_022488 [Plutella xylostella]|uniref:Uncharacterized protein n=1 Tax=Plutella xylostella TaxID=51655 RepID=A0ABQ7PR93_PLUXY|nr:hypothetical protein JYU34_022488 [Plutella xylostella]
MDSDKVKPMSAEHVPHKVKMDSDKVKPMSAEHVPHNVNALPILHISTDALNNNGEEWKKCPKISSDSL